MDPASLTPRAGPQQPHCSPLGPPVSPDTARPHTGHCGSSPARRQNHSGSRVFPKIHPYFQQEAQERGEPRRELGPVQCCTAPSSVEQSQAWLPWQHHRNGVWMVLHGSPRWIKQGGAGTPHCMDQRGFHTPKPALKHMLQHLPGCMSPAKRNPHLELTHNLAFEAFCSNRSSQGFTIPSSASGSQLPPHLFPSSTSSFLGFQPGFCLFYS